MSGLEPQETCKIASVAADAEFRAFLERSPTGIALVPKELDGESTPVMASGSGDFVKWLRTTHPQIHVTQPERSGRLLLHSEDVWLPLVFLASDVTLPVYLNLVSSYLYERLRGALRRDKPRVHLTAEYQDKSSGVTKRFMFDGDADTLRAAIKKIDLNEFLDDGGTQQ